MALEVGFNLFIKFTFIVSGYNFTCIILTEVIANRVISTERESLIIYLITQKANKLFFTVIVVGDEWAITLANASVLLLMCNELYLGHEAIIPVVCVLDPCDIVMVIEDPSVTLAALATMLLKM